MTRQIVFTIVGDGGTDRVLGPIIQWAIHRIDPVVDILEPEFRKRKGGVREFLEHYETGSMLLFVHRDSETLSRAERLEEFRGIERDDVVPVIPVRMSEAWLLIDGSAIATAAGRPTAEPQSTDRPEVRWWRRFVGAESVSGSGGGGLRRVEADVAGVGLSARRGSWRALGAGGVQPDGAGNARRALSVSVNSCAHGQFSGSLRVGRPERFTSVAATAIGTAARSGDI